MKKRTIQRHIKFTVEKHIHKEGWPFLRFLVDGEDVTHNTFLLSKFVEETTGATLPEREGRSFVSAIVTAIDIIPNGRSSMVFEKSFPDYSIHDTVEEIASVINIRLKMVREWVERLHQKKSTKAHILAPIVRK